MNNSRHPHHDLIVEWIKDTSKKYQVKMPHEDDSCFGNCSGLMVWNPSYDYREKPLEFTKGHWYPCLRDDGAVLVRMFDGLGMSLGVDVGLSVNPLQFKDIGESLGTAEFK